MANAAKVDIPLIGDVSQTKSGMVLMTVWHYDHGQILSQAEINLINSIMKKAGKTCDGVIHYTLRSLQYAFIANYRHQRNHKTGKRKYSAPVD